MRFGLHFTLALFLIGAAGCNGGRNGAPGPTMTVGDGGPGIQLMDGGGFGTDGGPAAPTPGTDGGTAIPPMPQAPGSACSCDADCQGDADHDGFCMMGVCMTWASASCASPGSAAECGAGSRCWGIEGVDRPICWPDCDASMCAGGCDGDGSCVPTEGMNCNAMCGSVCTGEGPVDPGPCTPANPAGDCPGTDETCVEGGCRTVCSTSNPTGYCPPGTDCSEGACRSAGGCPDFSCTGRNCSELIPMPGSHDPASPQARADGYYLGSEARYSYLRRDLTLLVRHAACEVMQHFPGTTPLGLSDLSQADGLTPGMDMGRARHPESTHRGNDLDVAYFQTDGANNPQIICGDGSDRNGNGSPGRFNNGYYCTTDDNIVDLEREAYFLAMMSRSDLVRVFGVDWKLPMSLQRSIGALRSSGAITAAEAARAQRLGYCRSAECPSGWSFHHHHTHLSYCPVGMPDC